MIEMLARVVPGSPGLQKGSGGRPALENSDILAALSMTDAPIGADLLLLRVAGLESVIPSLRERVLALLQTEATQREWRRPTKRDLSRTLEMMTALAISEHCIASKCKKCRGAGEVVLRGRRMSCRRCDGSGAREIETETSRAMLVGMSREAWRKRWSTRYQWLRAELQYQEAKARRDFRRAISEKRSHES